MSKSEQKRLDAHAASDIEVIAKVLGEHFKDDPRKITYWLFCKNTMLGGISAAQLIIMGRAHKVRQFVEDCKEGNFP